MFNLSELKPERGCTDWYCEAADGSSLLIHGTEQAPTPSSIEDARSILAQYETIKELAIKLLESFMKDRGRWFLSAIYVGPFSTQNDGFESDTNRHEYSSTGFTVNFTLGKQNSPPLNKPHPFKFTVEFS